MDEPASTRVSRNEPAPATSAWFVDVAAQSGVRFRYRNGEEAGHASILESLGGGVALFDYDGDGSLDVFAPGGGAFGPGQDVSGLSPALYRNHGAWNFTEVTSESGMRRAPYYSHGAAVADFDNDGFPDVLVTGYGGMLLFQNQGDGTFRETAAAAGLEDPLWSTSAAWGDLDGDGNLDLYVARYVNWSFDNHPYCPAAKRGQRDICAPKFFDGVSDSVFLSNGDGTFRDVSPDVGLSAGGKGLGVLLADLDLDGHLDVYVCNDTEPNFLYRNDGEGMLVEFGMLSGTALSDKGVPEGSMGIDLADFNRNGRPDLWVTNYERESIGLYRNDGHGSFQYVSQSTGVAAVGGLHVGWGAVFIDFDLDGFEDAFVSNGHVERYPENAPVRQTPLLFHNEGGRWFRNVAPGAGEYTASAHMGRGVAAGDLDNNGRIDLAVSHVNEPLALLANRSRHENHWLSLRLIGARSNRSAIGARVRLKTAGSEQWRHVKGGGSYLSTSDPRLCFGLGRETVVETIEIRWPAGAVQSLHAVAADQFLTVIEPATDREAVSFAAAP